MGLLDWLKRTPEHKTATWLRGQIAERAASRDAVALAEACSALAGVGTMAFGMVISEFPGRADVREKALEALRTLVTMLDDAQCAAVFDIIARAQLPVDIADRRARWEAERRAQVERAIRELRSRIANADPCGLVRACGHLRACSRRVLGVELGDIGDARTALFDDAMAHVRALIPTLADDECREVFKAIRRANLPIDIAARSAELDERREAKLASALSAVANEPTNPELERAIAERPDDDHAWSVLADWLVERGHPRGELIALQLRAETEPALAGAADACIEANAGALLGPLAAHRLTHDGDETPAFAWRRGFIDRARLSVDDNAAPAPVEHDLAQILALLLGHPSGRRLAALEIGINGETNGPTLDDVLAVLVRERPAMLRELRLGTFTQEQSEISWYEIGNVAPLWPALPSLRTLVIHGGHMALGAIDHVRLERLQIETGGLDAANAHAIAAAKLPRLRHLDVWYGDPHYGGDAMIGDVRPLVERTDLPALEHLGLMNCAFTDAICELLPASSIAAQLRELDLSMGTMGAAGAHALATGAKAFAKLESIDVSENYLDRDSLALLQRAFARVVSSEQRHDNEDRYPSVGE